MKKKNPRKIFQLNFFCDIFNIKKYETQLNASLKIIQERIFCLKFKKIQKYSLKCFSLLVNTQILV